MKNLTSYEEKLINEVDMLKENMIEDLISLLNIPSKKDQPVEDAPFGREIKKVLEKAIEIMEREGLRTSNVDNYMAYGSIGESNDYICILGHLDVVDEGNHDDWTYPPFAGVIHDNKIYARGALDNKGPIVASLYGLLALKNLGYNFNNEIRIIFGTDEESGMSDLEYYLDHNNPPVLGFVPDNKFPAIYGERGRIELIFRGDVDEFYDTYLKDRNTLLEKLGIDFKDISFGKTIVKKLDKKENEIRIVLSTPSLEIYEFMENIKAKAKDLEIDLKSYYEPALKSRNSLLVSTLNKAYNDYRGENIEPTTTTGITYAHMCPNVIGFGPSFPGQNGISHAPDEWIDIDDLVEMAKIYALAIYRLDNIRGY